MSFGAWLWTNRYNTNDTKKLYAFANDVAGPSWPMLSPELSVYQEVIKAILPVVDQADMLTALEKIWPLYQMRDRSDGSITNSLMKVLDFKVWLGVLGVLLFLFVFYKFNYNTIEQLSDLSKARGAVSFFIAIATVGIAAIIVVSSFMATGTKDDLEDRFRRGKDILTALLGILGTIVGFYFAQATTGARPPPPDPASNSTANTTPAVTPAGLPHSNPAPGSPPNPAPASPTQGK